MTCPYELKGCGGTAPTTLRAVPPLLELLAVATAVASSLRLGSGAVALATRPTVLLQQPSNDRSGPDRLRMIRFIGPLGVVSVLVASILFAALNGAQRITLNLGVTVLYGVPLTVVGFTGLFMGMVVMLVAGVRSDLKVRALLRQRLEEEDREERALIDRTQQDLFSPPPVEGDSDGGEAGVGEWDGNREEVP